MEFTIVMLKIRLSVLDSQRSGGHHELSGHDFKTFSIS